MRTHIEANAHAHCDVFQDRLPWQEMVKLNKGSIFVIAETQFAIKSLVMKQTNCTEGLHVDATIMRSFQTELFSSFLSSTYAGHVNLAAAKPWQFMPNWKDGSTVEFIIKNFLLKISFLPLELEVSCHNLIRYDYIVKLCSGIYVYQSLDIA